MAATKGLEEETGRQPQVSWIFGTMAGFARGNNIAAMLNEQTGLGLSHYEYGVLHLAFFDLEFTEPQDVLEHVGGNNLSEAMGIITGLIDKGLMERDADGDFSLTANGYDAQEHVNEVFEVIACMIEETETRRRMPVSKARGVIN